MNQKFLLYVAPLLLLTAPLQQAYALSPDVESIENKDVKKISIQMESLSRGESFSPTRILNKLHTKEGDPFDQTVFDQDLKTLSMEYDRVEPVVSVHQGQVYITIKIWEKPLIRSISWHGNKNIKTKKLQKQLGIKPNVTFNRNAFNKAFNKVKEYYIKKGYFESQLSYRIIHQDNSNEVDIDINVSEGKSGHISQIVFEGLSKNEQSALLEMINTKKHNFFTSWITGSGTYHEEALEHDKLIIINYLQNKGFADAKVNITIGESKKDGKIIIYIKAKKGNLFHFNNITFSGNHLFDDQKIDEKLLIHDGDIYSIDKLRETVQNIKDLYGSKGYIEANVNYTLRPVGTGSQYNVHIDIEEGEEYKIGLIRVLGNVQTNKNVILRESLLEPGEVFDSRKLKATQNRLQAVGYFKSVNVYAIKSSYSESLGENYRDVIIEVEETTTGNLSLFFGFSTTDDLFGGLDITENNFNYKGLSKIWKEGLPAVRGGGEYAHARVSIGQNQSNYLISWLTPYYRDTLWRVGFDVSYSESSIQSKDYDVNTVGTSIYGSYPLNQFWTTGWKYRVRNSIIHIHGNLNETAKKQQKNSGWLMGVGGSLSYDSTDNAFKPHRGIRSIFDAELAGAKRHASHDKYIPFVKTGYVNTFYYPIWKKGTLKTRADVKFIYTFGESGKPRRVPLNERFFLGGETTVRGYKPFKLGPKYKEKDLSRSDDPQGGMSSMLFSTEYLQEVFKLLDLFVFFDAGSVSMNEFAIPSIKFSCGGGARIDIGNRLPLIVGYGYPINPDSSKDVKKFFFSMGGQF